MNSVRLNNLGLKYQKFTPADEKIQGFDNLRGKDSIPLKKTL